MLSVNVGTIQDFIDMGRLVVEPPDDRPEMPTPVLTMKDLVEAGICTKSSVKHGMKLLAKGKDRLRTPFQLQISRASEAAIQAVEEVGGQITTVHYNRLALRALLSPEKFAMLPKFARPPPKWQGYYSDWDRNRGYLSVQAQMRNLLQNRRPDLQFPFAKGLEDRLLKDKELEEEK
jgi:large subunit ribosomal protein L15